MRRAALYLRVSSFEQSTENQARELRSVAERLGCEIVAVHDAGSEGGGRPSILAMVGSGRRLGSNQKS